MKNQRNNRKKTHTTYSITNTHTHINIDKYTQKTEMNGTICFLKQFFVSKPGWIKPPPNVLKNPHEPAFHPWVFPKRSLDSPKTTPNQKKKNPKKTKKIPKQFRTQITTARMVHQRKVGSCSRAVWPLTHRWGSRGAESFLQVIGFCDVNDLFSLEAESYLLEFWVFWTELRAISQDDLKEKAKVAGEEDSVQKLDRWLLLCGGIHSKHSVGGPEMRRAFVLFDSFPLLKKRCFNIPFFTTKLFIYRAKARACHLTKIQGWNANLFLLNLIWVDFSEFFTFSVWVTSFCFGERWICDEIQLWVVVVCLFLNHGCHLAATTKNMEKMQMISRRQGCDCSPRLWPWLWRRGFGRVRG